MVVYVDASPREPEWGPLEQLAGALSTAPDAPDIDPGDFMYMTKMADRKGNALHLYKHIDTRRYLNLDDAGHAHEFVRVATLRHTDELAGVYRLARDLRVALDHLELDSELVRRWHEP